MVTVNIAALITVFVIMVLAIVVSLINISSLKSRFKYLEKDNYRLSERLAVLEAPFACEIGDEFKKPFIKGTFRVLARSRPSSGAKLYNLYNCKTMESEAVFEPNLLKDPFQKVS